MHMTAHLVDEEPIVLCFALLLGRVHQLGVVDEVVLQVIPVAGLPAAAAGGAAAAVVALRVLVTLLRVVLLVLRVLVVALERGTLSAGA
jgi:hypothetical protein